MSLRSLQKWHGAGNDFLVDVIEHGTAPWWDARRARAVCARATGIGADGLLVATVGPVVAMELFNADGSVAEMSGNGIRCLAAAVARATNAAWKSLDVHTRAGVRTVSLDMNGDSGTGSVAMGAVTFHDDLPGVLGVADLGNPHVVVLDQPAWSATECERIAGDLANRIGGANVEFVTIVDRANCAIRVIERGVGWTLACGTGSCATAAVLRRADLVDDALTVENPGGPLHVTLEGDNATLSGPVQFIANVEWLEA